MQGKRKKMEICNVFDFVFAIPFEEQDEILAIC